MANTATTAPTSAIAKAAVENAVVRAAGKPPASATTSTPSGTPPATQKPIMPIGTSTEFQVGTEEPT